MIDYKAVRSGLEISRRIVDRLEATAATDYLFGERARAINSINGILQGRFSRTVDELLTELEKLDVPQFTAIQQEVTDFLRQKELLSRVYDKDCHGKRYVFRKYKRDVGPELKEIDQQLYDRAARQGFPADFFRNAYFDQVTFYCLPDDADFSGSELHHCNFAVCRINCTSFFEARLYNCEFYTSILNHVQFTDATLAHTHFHDCELSNIMLHAARMNRCHVIDCTLDHVNFLRATLDGCSFARVIVGTIRNLDEATITQSGSTNEESCRHKTAIYHALGVSEVAA